MKNKEIVIVGAGISGISCALTLLNENYTGNITIIEQGHNSRNRICNLDEIGVCSDCSPCNTISGFGGSLHYGDTVKLSCFPSGKRLLNIIGNRSEKYQDIALSYFSKNKQDFISPSQDSSSLIKKTYPISILHSNEAKMILDKWTNELLNHQNLLILYDSKVKNLRQTGNSFSISYVKQGEKNINADIIVLCTGRAGFRMIKDFTSNLEVELKPPHISMGFRFLMPNYILDKVSDIHPNFKTSLAYSNYKYKTFCFSAGKLGGRIKHANHGDFMLIDGHSITDTNTPSAISNFAILSQLIDSSGNFYNYDWIKNNILPVYRELNSIHKGKPVLQSYNDFKARRITNSSHEHLSKLKSKTYATGNLSSLIPSLEQHNGFCHTLETLIQEFCRISEVKEDLHYVLSQISVLGLELESIWDEIELNQNMETNIPYLFIAGDSSGLAQGILQAAISGVAAAYGIIEKKK